MPGVHHLARHNVTVFIITLGIPLIHIYAIKFHITCNMKQILQDTSQNVLGGSSTNFYSVCIKGQAVELYSTRTEYYQPTEGSLVPCVLNLSNPSGQRSCGPFQRPK